MEKITREVIEDVGPDGIDVRLYSRGDVDLPSVTTVLNTRNEDKSNLYAWQDRNDGEGNNAYHEHLFWYKRHRGTLCHWHALSKLDEDLAWSDDEQSSFEELWDQNDDDVKDATPREVLYSVMKDVNAVDTWGDFYERHPPYEDKDYYREELMKWVDQDIGFFVEAFERVCNKLGVSSDNIIAVEKFLFEVEFGYAGQVDLIYEDDDGEIVVADLKTSGGCYDKHKIQGAAYGRAAERSDLGFDKVDRLEVWRFHPDTGNFAVHSHDATISGLHIDSWWKKTYDDLWCEFKVLARDFEYDTDADTDGYDGNAKEQRHG